MEKQEILKRQIIYRAKNRGTKENDILIGSLIDSGILNNLTFEELEDFLELLDENDLDIYNYFLNIGNLSGSYRSSLLKKLKKYRKLNETSWKY